MNPSHDDDALFYPALASPQVYQDPHDLARPQAGHGIRGSLQASAVFPEQALCGGRRRADRQPAATAATEQHKLCAVCVDADVDAHEVWQGEKQGKAKQTRADRCVYPFVRFGRHEWYRQGLFGAQLFTAYYEPLQLDFQDTIKGIMRYADLDDFVTQDMLIKVGVCS